MSIMYSKIGIKISNSLESFPRKKKDPISGAYCPFVILGLKKGNFPPPVLSRIIHLGTIKMSGFMYLRVD